MSEIKHFIEIRIETQYLIGDLYTGEAGRGVRDGY